MMSDSINEIENKIKTTEDEIAKAQKEIEQVRQDLSNETDPESKKLWLTQLTALRNTEAALREKEYLLLKKKLNQLPPKSPSSNSGSAFGKPQPSAGEQQINQIVPRNSPSSEAGQAEGLEILNDDKRNHIYCSANSVALNMLRLLEESIPNTETKNMKTTELLPVATRYFMNVLERQRKQELFMGGNERLVTGAFCDALNSILPAGLAACHQACIGVGVSARCMKMKGTPTLMIGEAKVGDDLDIRNLTRGQILNELTRHRKLDYELNSGKTDFRPILLIALNYSYISIDLAFPSSSNGYMHTSGWVRFDEKLAPDTETFWTTQLANVYIADSSGPDKIAAILSFISKALDFLSCLSDRDTCRVQFKTPWIQNPLSCFPVGAWRHGDNVTIVQGEHGERMVFKEYCYYLRQVDGFNHINDTSVMVEERDQRRPPPQNLLEELGAPYDTWKVVSGPFRIKILVYEEIPEDRHAPSLEGWLQVLSQIQKMHELGFVHGDLLPRNLVFGRKSGNVIDFDLSRVENEAYVIGYNHDDFTDYRHPNARSGLVMSKVHDVHSLKAIAKEFFHLNEDVKAKLDKIDEIKALDSFFKEARPDLKEIVDTINETATGTPIRHEGTSSTELLSQAVDNLTLH